MAKNTFNSRKLVSFGDPSAAEGGWYWGIVSIFIVFLIWCFFSNAVPQQVNDTMSKLPQPIAERLTPEENEMFWLPTPGEVWTKSVDLYKNGYRNARDINPYPWIVDTYAAPWPLFKNKAPGFIPNADELNKALVDESGAVITDNDGVPKTQWTELKSSAPVSYRQLNKNEDGEALAATEQNYNFFANGMPILRGHLWDSLYRVLAGFFWGCLFGIPIGIAMALSKFARGFFDPIIEFYRPIPPLAWAPLIIAILGIGEEGKIFLLFMAALSIMVIAGRAGALSVNLSKVHAAYSLGASKLQVLKNVILPNSMPEILTGMRVTMGVCWGTVVAAEMIAGISGTGFSVNAARRFFSFDIIWSGIILMGIMGILIDLVMRGLINWLTPWQGKAG